ncbi:MAG: CCA tRNA nucleotidyltransferase [Pirellulaceae bacterium]|nr:CCA tRNA nucleotidyltransferase [Pirellulaceae bacterium]
MNARREFAKVVVQKLRDCGFDALWAGGCVRDELLGQEPRDYDVATSATPVQIQEVFSQRKTLAIGSAFGVITVLGGPRERQIDVATFRRDIGYSDGRHPDCVEFTSAEEDALRRDFTINGLFFDPIKEEVIDYVGGRQDLEQRVIRAIQNPVDRFDEDKLRMLRAVRFATTYDFEIEENTFRAMQAYAQEITVVSAERVTAELRRILEHSNRLQGVDLLAASGILQVLLPEMSLVSPACQNTTCGEVPAETRQMLKSLTSQNFAPALAILLRIVRDTPGRGKRVVEQICRSWKLSNDEIKLITFLLKNEFMIRQAKDEPWPQVQRLLVDAHAAALFAFGNAVAMACDSSNEHLEFCQRKLALPPHELNPPMLIAGKMLTAAGMLPGPAYKEILQRVRDAQLNGEISTQAEALSLARHFSE